MAVFTKSPSILGELDASKLALTTGKSVSSKKSAKVSGPIAISLLPMVYKENKEVYNVVNASKLVSEMPNGHS